MWWYMPVITALGRLRQEDQIQGQPGLHCETLSQKIINKVSSLGSVKKKKKKKDCYFRENNRIFSMKKNSFQ
jgi:hypothetical protein